MSKVIKQGFCTSDCMACVAAMATDTDIDDFMKFWKHVGPYSTLELNIWCTLHGYQFGAQFSMPDESYLTFIDNVLNTCLDITNQPCFIGVRSDLHTCCDHGVYWDGEKVLDPNPYINCDGLDLDCYDIQIIAPIFKIIDGPIVDITSVKLIKSCNSYFDDKGNMIFLKEFPTIVLPDEQ